MKIIITESQHKKILLESISENLKNKLVSLRSFFVDTAKTVKSQFGIDMGGGMAPPAEPPTA